MGARRRARRAALNSIISPDENDAHEPGVVPPYHLKEGGLFCPNKDCNAMNMQ
jgi:hypothetical protein